MKTLKGLNEKVAIIGANEGPVPTFKEVALNTAGMYRPDPKKEIVPAERIKVTNIGLILLTAKDELELEDEQFETLKIVMNKSMTYPEFIMGQWTKKLNDAELNGASGKKEK